MKYVLEQVIIQPVNWLPNLRNWVFDKETITYKLEEAKVFNSFVEAKNFKLESQFTDFNIEPATWLKNWELNKQMEAEIEQ